MHAMEAIVDPVSLYEPVYSDNGDSIFLMDQLSDTSISDEKWLENISNFKIDDDWIVEVAEFAVDCFC